MKKLALLLIPFIILGCQNLKEEEIITSSSISQIEETSQSTPQEKETVPTIIDPPYSFNIDEMVPSDFGDFFKEDYPTEVTTRKLMENTDTELEVTVLKGSNEGKILYIVAGVHGDEIAAWNTGNLLKKAKIKSGEIHIISPANPWGATSTPRSRYVAEKQDLNRSFPGDEKGNKAEIVASAIFNDIKEVSPFFLFDLHEARINTQGRDFLGSSLIYTSLENMSDLYFDLISATETGEICSQPFTFYSPGPDGSINNAVTNLLNIPTITVETYRGYEMENRIGDQLDIVNYLLAYYDMI